MPMSLYVLMPLVIRPIHSARFIGEARDVLCPDFDRVRSWLIRSGERVDFKHRALVHSDRTDRLCFEPVSLVEPKPCGDIESRPGAHVSDRNPDRAELEVGRRFMPDALLVHPSVKRNHYRALRFGDRPPCYARDKEGESGKHDRGCPEPHRGPSAEIRLAERWGKHAPMIADPISTSETRLHACSSERSTTASRLGISHAAPSRHYDPRCSAAREPHRGPRRGRPNPRAYRPQLHGGAPKSSWHPASKQGTARNVRAQITS